MLAVILAPIDVIATPFWFVGGAVDHVGVSDEELVRAASGRQRARELGITEARVDGTGHWGWPYPHDTHLDALGYDAEWLRRNAPR